MKKMENIEVKEIRKTISESKSKGERVPEEIREKVN